MARPHTMHTTALRAPWGWTWTGAVLGLVLATVLWAPARWLADALARFSDNRVQLHSAQGTVWNGTARLVLRAGNDADAASTLPDTVQWRLRPRWDGARLTLAAPCCLDSPWHWQVRVGWQAVQLLADDLPASASHWPAALLSGLGTPWNTVLVQGTLALHTQGLQIRLERERWTLQGTVAVDALGMRTALSTLQPLGSYRLALQGGATPQLMLSTLNGALLLSGQGQLVQGRWRFVGEARSSEAAQGALGNLLNIIGRREGARSVITVG